MTYYPAQTLVLPLAIIRRERRLPEGAISESAINEGNRVSPEDVVLRGLVPADFIILDALKPLGLRKVEDLTDAMIITPVGSSVQAGDVILANRRRQIKAPSNAVFARLDGGQAILQANPESVEVRAMCTGEVRSVRNNKTEVLIETIGTLIQCTWGNGQRAFSSYKMEPKTGIIALLGETLLPEYRSFAMVLQKSILSPEVFAAAAQQQMSGLIAPSMHANLRELACQQSYPILLTEGFGELQMSEIVYNLLRDNLTRQALLDASEPSHWSSDRPEIIIPSATSGITATAPETNQPLETGATVRVTRAPYAGQSGQVRRLVELPRAVDNGLRLSGAEVQLASGRSVFVPLANLEMLGRPVETES